MGDVNDEEEDTEETSEVAGDNGGDKEHSLPQDLKLRSSGVSSSGY